MKHKCLICKRITAIKEKNNPYFVRELKTGYIVLGDYQFYKGYTLFLCKMHVPELHMLSNPYQKLFLEELAYVGKAVFTAFRPIKLNYEILGNNDPHLHCHIFPRYINDPNKTQPIWVIPESMRCAESTKPDNVMLKNLKKTLLAEL